METTTFEARRIRRSFDHTVAAEPDKVFPLLCPVREYDWIPSWECQIVHSESGVAEQGCVFRTSFPQLGESIWTVSLHEPRLHRIAFVVVTPATHVETLEVEVDGCPGGSTLRWVRTYTGLNEAGNALLDHFTGAPLEARMQQVMKMLEHYCTTGEMVRPDRRTGGRVREVRP